MSVLQYFKLKRPVLPNPNGLLAKVVPSSSIIVANEAVKYAISKTSDTSKASSEGECSVKGRGPDVQFTPEEKVRIGKQAVGYGVASTV